MMRRTLMIAALVALGAGSASAQDPDIEFDVLRANDEIQTDVIDPITGPVVVDGVTVNAHGSRHRPAGGGAREDLARHQVALADRPGERAEGRVVSVRDAHRRGVEDGLPVVVGQGVLRGLQEQRGEEPGDVSGPNGGDRPRRIRPLIVPHVGGHHTARGFRPGGGT